MQKYKNIYKTTIANKVIFIRSDMNVPLNESYKISDDTRIKASIATIKYALDAGAKIILATHLGRPVEGNNPDTSTSVQQIANTLSHLLNIDIEIIGVKDIANISWSKSSLFLLENVRLNIGEKANSPTLAQEYAKGVDVFVHDAFATSHRKEASTYGIAEYTKDKCAGILFDQEYQALSKIINSTGTKLAVIGGSKVSTKLSVLKNLAHKFDYLCLGGGILNTFLLAKNINIGKSLAEPELLQEVNDIVQIMTNKNGEILLPEYVVTITEFSPQAPAQIKHINNITSNDIIIDIALASAYKIAETIARASLILWNGPVGIFEWESACLGTQIIAESIAQSSGYSVAGGGDSIAAINKFNISGIDYISTAGGAMLEFLAGNNLPGIEILTK